MDTERLRINKPANPGANATVTLYDDTTIGSDDVTHRSRVEIELYSDVVVTIVHQWSDTPTGTLRQVSSTATTANTLYDARPRLRVGFNKITAVTTTAATVWQIAVGTNSNPVADA